MEARVVRQLGVEGREEVRALAEGDYCLGFGVGFGCGFDYCLGFGVVVVVVVVVIVTGGGGGIVGRREIGRRA